MNQRQKRLALSIANITFNTNPYRRAVYELRAAGWTYDSLYKCSKTPEAKAIDPDNGSWLRLLNTWRDIELGVK